MLFRSERAACKLQRVYRGHLVRNDVNNTKFQLLYGHMATSVTTVANNYRMHVARRRRTGSLAESEVQNSVPRISANAPPHFDRVQLII